MLLELGNETYSIYLQNGKIKFDFLRLIYINNIYKFNIFFIRIRNHLDKETIK